MVITKNYLNQFWIIKRIYEKYYASKKYYKIHLDSFKEFIKNIIGCDIEDYNNIIKELTMFKELNEYVNYQFKSAGLTYS